VAWHACPSSSPLGERCPGKVPQGAKLLYPHKSCTSLAGNARASQCVPNKHDGIVLCHLHHWHRARGVCPTVLVLFFSSSLVSRPLLTGGVGELVATSQIALYSPRPPGLNFSFLPSQPLLPSSLPPSVPQSPSIKPFPPFRESSPSTTP
jgi:hypothetical protein